MFKINSKSKIFIAAEFSYLLGNIIYGIFENKNLILPLSLGVAFCFSVVSNKKVFVFFLVLICTFIGGFYFLEKDLSYKNAKINNFLETKIEARGIIIDEIEEKNGKQKCKIKLQEVKNKFNSYQVNDKVLISTDKYPKLDYGHEIKITGEFKKAGFIEDFNYEKYLLKEGIVAVSYNAKTEILNKKKGNLFFGTIYKIKGHFTDSINQTFHEPEASFLAGLLVGERRSIPKDLIESFSVTGTTHIIAISGYNITLISALLISFLKNFFKRGIIIFIILFALFTFVILTGAEASVVRAAIMGGIVLLSSISGRLSNVTGVLILSAVIMSFLNPFVIVHDIGFQLSYLSTLGLLYFSEGLKEKLSFMKNTFDIKDSLSLTLASQFTTMPIAVYHFGRISLIAPIVNVIVLPLIPFSMFVGFFATIVNFFSSSFAKIISWPAFLCLKLKILVITFFSKIPFISIDISKESRSTVLMIWVILLFIIIVILKMKKDLKKDV